MENGEKSFHKIFDLLELIGGSRDPQPVKALASRLGLPESTVYRILKFLTKRGYVERTPSGFFLGGCCLRLGGMAQEQNILSRLARPVLGKLAEDTLETVHLASLQGTHIVYIDKIEGVRSIRMGSMIGLSSPLHCTGIGKAMLATMDKRELDEILPLLNLERFTESTFCDVESLGRELENTRKRGYAIDDCEHEIGVYCIAAAVLDRRGRAAAGISIAGSSIYLKPHTADLAEKVCAAAEAISAKL